MGERIAPMLVAGLVFYAGYRSVMKKKEKAAKKKKEKPSEEE